MKAFSLLPAICLLALVGCGNDGGVKKKDAAKERQSAGKGR
ncbi:MAG TPA: hypothetical protein VFM57_17680 [Thermoleophilaceae bacterium]|nr:hypothetical protein [Thermoleophilaceae bacterium]